MTSGNQSESGRRRSIAAIVTAFFPVSHADVILSRWKTPYPGDEQYGWNGSSFEIASLWIAQFPPNDIGRQFAQENGIRLCSTIEEALTLGTGSVAVDGVLLIAEHGEYPVNEIGQKLYPRKEFFDEVVRVFERSSRAVPVFCDKHLSWNPAWAVEMAFTAQRLGFPLLAGSSAPHCRLLPAEPLQPYESLVEAMGVAYGSAEAYGFHSLELLQSVIEKRAGGERGICAVTAWQGPEVWDVLSPELEALALAAIRRAPSRKEGDFRVNTQGALHPPTLFSLDHLDGMRSHHLLLSGHLSEFTVSVRLPSGEIRAACAEMGGRDGFYPNFAQLNRAIEAMLVHGEPSFPDRTLLTSIVIATCLKALQHSGCPQTLSPKKRSGTRTGTD